jgi:type IV secretion system protein TrbB
MHTQRLTQKRHHSMLNTAFGDELVEFLMQDDVLEIMLNPDGQLWLETLGQGKFFTGFTLLPEQAANIIKLIASQYHLIIDDKNPELACELKQFAARFQAWLPPVVNAPVFNIRKLASRIFTLNDYVVKNILSQTHQQLLQEAISQKHNILIAGGTGSGKTTFANALLHELNNSQDRILILEDLPELQIHAPDHVHLRTTNEKSMRDLVKGALRMRPDRIIIGEVREGGAALELLKAWNTGHPGGLCTIHANSAQAALTRLEDLLLEVVQTVPMRLIGEAIQVIVFMARNHEGQHVVRDVYRVVLSEGQFILKKD